MLFFLVIWLFLMKSCVKGTFLVVPDSTISDNITQSLTNVTFDFSVSRALQSWTHVTFLTTYQEDEETWHDKQKDKYKCKKEKYVHTYKEKHINNFI